MGIKRRYWCLSLFTAFLAHIVFALAIYWPAADTGAKSAGVGGIEVTLGTSGSAPGSVAAAEAAETQEAQPETADKAEEVPPSPDAPTPDDVAETEIETEVEAVPVEKVWAARPETANEIVEAMAPVEETPPPAQPATLTAVVAQEPAEIEVRVPQAAKIETAPTAIERSEVAEPPIEQVKEQKPKEPPPRPKVKPTPTPEPEPQKVVEQPPEPVKKPVEVQEAKEVEQKQTVAARASIAGAAGQSGTQETGKVGSAASDARAGGIAGAYTDYASLLISWLERHKKYPRRARIRRREGLVLLYIVIDRSGNVVEYRIKESSGSRLLDKATLDMLRRAQPLPPMPDDMDQNRVRFVVPVRFNLS